MISIKKILKRSWHILWSYRTLWIFGVLLALTTGGGSSGNSGSSSRSSSNNTRGFQGILPENAPQWLRDLSQWFTRDVLPIFTNPAQHIGTIVTIGVLIFLVILLISTLAALVRYPAETAVIRMVDEYEQSGSKLGFRQGWKLGWTRRAFRLWLIDLVMSLPFIVLILMIAGAGVIVFLSVSSTFQVTNVIGIVAAIGLAFLSIIPMVVLAVILSLLRNFFGRAAALEGLGVRASLLAGWDMFRRHWKSAGLMWLVMIGIGFGFGIAGVIAFFLLIPAYLVLLLPAALTAAVPAVIAYGITSLFTSGPLTWIIALLAAIPFFFTVVFAPLFLVNGWYHIYESNVWTLTYREIKALDSLAAPVAAAGEISPLE